MHVFVRCVNGWKAFCDGPYQSLVASVRVHPSVHPSNAFAYTHTQVSFDVRVKCIQRAIKSNDSGIVYIKWTRASDTCCGRWHTLDHRRPLGVLRLLLTSDVVNTMIRTNPGSLNLEACSLTRRWRAFTRPHVVSSTDGFYYCACLSQSLVVPFLANSILCTY